MGVGVVAGTAVAVGLRVSVGTAVAVGLGATSLQDARASGLKARANRKAAEEP